MSDHTTEEGKIDIGRVVQQTFGVLGRNFATFGLLALVLVGLPAAMMGWFRPAQDPSRFFAMFDVTFLLATIVSAVFGAILQGAVIYGTVQDLNGARATPGDALATGLRSFLPLIIVSILFTLAFWIGLILLIVPGLAVACLWCVAVPALVAERRGVFDAFGRSNELTRGNRGRILALIVILLVAYTVLGWVVTATTSGAAMAAAMTGEPFRYSPTTIVLNALVGTVSSLVGAVGAAVLYVNLREAREGGGAQWLREVFA